MRKVIKILIVLLQLFVFFKFEYAQFHVVPTVQLEIDMEQGYPYPPSKIRFIGCFDNGLVYSVKIDASTKRYSIHNVKPGQYLIYITDGKGSPFFQYQTLTLYNSEKQIFSRKNTDILNKIDVREDQNLKLKIAFKTCTDYYGFQPVLNSKLKDFDLIEINYYSALPINNSPSVMSMENNIMFSSTSSSSSDFCGGQSGEWSKSLGYSCTMDSGNIEIKLKNAYFKNTWIGEVANGTTIGNTTIGIQGPNNFTCGVCSTYGVLLDESITDVPQGWEKISATGTCDDGINKCKLSFEFNLGVVMETAVWNHDEMCKNVLGYDGKILYDSNMPTNYTCNCDCYLEAVTAHEAQHCLSWMNATNAAGQKFQAYCSANQNKYSANSCCKNDGGDEKCKEQAEELKYIIFADLVTAQIADVFFDTNNSPESTSDSAELAKFRQCRASKHCRY